jgi:hypothetical protein
VRHAVVGDALARRHCFLFDGVRYAQPAAARRAGRGCLLPAAPGLDTLKEADKGFSVLGIQARGRLHVAERFVQITLRGRAGERFRAHGLHNVLRQHAAHHRQFGTVRGVVEQLQLRQVLTPEEGARGGVTEARGDHDPDGALAGPHGFPVGFFVPLRVDLKRFVGRQRVDRAFRDRAAVLVDDGNLDLRRLAVADAAEQVAEEGRDDDRRDEAHRHRAFVQKEQSQIAPHESEKRGGIHALRTLLPVRVRNTVSRSARWLAMWAQR